MRIDFGKLTTEQTKEIAKEALSELSLEDQIEVIKEVAKDPGEIAAQLGEDES